MTYVRVITRINRALKSMGYDQYEFVRSPAGYYYVSGVAVESSLMVYNCQDWIMAKEHVEDVLTRETGHPFVIKEN